jgi:O-antigen/teichoic acid export membrane protein
LRLLRPKPGADGAAEEGTSATNVTPRRALGDIVAQIGGQVLNLCLGIVTTVVLARSLGTTHYGEWATLLAVSQLVAVVGNLGLQQVAVRYASQEPEQAGRWVGAATTLALALSVPTLAAFIVVVALVADDRQMVIAGVILSILFFTAAISTLRIVFRLSISNHIYILFLTANSVIWAAAVILIAGLGGGLVAFAAAFCLASIVTQGAMALVALRSMHVRWRGSRELWGPIVRVGIPVGLAATLTLAYGQIDQILVYKLAPNADEPGIYAAVYKFLESAGAVPAAVMTTLFPLMAAAYYAHDSDRLRRLYQSAVDYLTVLSFGALAFTIVASGPLVQLLYGSEFAGGADILPILFASFVPSCIGHVAGNMTIATDQQRQFVWYALVGLVVNLGLNAFLIPDYGIEGAAWATLATEVAVNAITTVVVVRRLEMSLALGRIGLAAAAATLSALGLWGLRELGFGALALIASMAVLYPATLLALRALDYRELRELMAARREAV